MGTTAERLQDMALDLITRKGCVASWQQDDVTASEVTGEVTVNATESYPIRIVPPEALRAAYVDGETTQMGDLVTYLAAKNLGFTPANGDRLVILGETYRAVIVERTLAGLDSAGSNVVALWRVVMRR